MSVKKPISFLLIFVLLVGGVFLFFQNRNKTQPTLSERSANQLPWAHSLKGKHNQALVLSVDSEPLGDTVLLTLNIQSEAQLKDPDLSVQWILPEGVDIVQGRLQDAVFIQDTSTIKKLEIQVTGFSEDSLKTVVAQVGNEVVPTQAASIASRLTRAQRVIEVMHEQDNN